MKKKYMYAIFFLLMIMAIVLCISRYSISRYSVKEKVFDFTNLTLDQGNAYISISKNDMSGYNRWLPFYFKISCDAELTEAEVEEFLNENVLNASLYSGEDQRLYVTEQLVWSACKIDDRIFNLTLVLIPELNSFNINGVTQIDKIVLASEKSFCEYKLSSYLVEQRETISESEMYVSLSSITAKVPENLTTQINYGIMMKEYEISTFDIYFDKQFDDIASYQIMNAEVREDNSVYYSVAITLNKKNSRTVFRPFLKVSYSDHIGWMVPCVPVYFE